MELVDVSYSIPPREAEPVVTAWEQFVLFLQEHWQNLSLMSLVFCGMAVLYLISKPPKPDSIAIIEGMETPLEAIDARLAEKQRLEEERLAAEAAEVAAAVEQEEFENSLNDLGSIRSLRDEIAELIAKNPEAAAAVIRQWIGNSVLVEANT
jgi:flagellar biosynthesis/type III secretory pathway M-ring protein FliF/YscJ